MMFLKRATREGVNMLLIFSTESVKMLMLFEEQPSLESLWKDFEIPLLDVNGAPITIISKDPKSLHSILFLTKPHEHGKLRRARVVELIGDFDKNYKRT